MNRREAIITMGLAAGALAANIPASAAEAGDFAGVLKSKYPFSLPPLPYAYGALEPFIDEETMKIHHDKHHAAYVTNLNKALESAPDSIKQMPLETLLKSLDSVPEGIRAAVRNNAGGHANHSLFWITLKKGDGTPSGKLAEGIKASFGGFEGFKEKWTAAAKGVFGSGWAWLAAGPSGKLEILTTPNQDTPLSNGVKPLLGIDVWEHAYYLKYQNRRPDYIEAFFNVIDWEAVEKGV